MSRAFVGGIFLVPALHIAFSIGWAIISALIIATVPFFNRDYNFFLLAYPVFLPGLIQTAYLIPAYTYFANKQRRETCKGIIAGAIIVLLLNSACFGSMISGGIGRFDLAGILLLVGSFLVPLSIGFLVRFLINRRRDQA
jgi:hypothetical protein